MKKEKIVKMMGSAILVGAMGVTGFAVNADELSEEEMADMIGIEETDDETECWGCCSDDYYWGCCPYDEEYYCGCCGYDDYYWGCCSDDYYWGCCPYDEEYYGCCGYDDYYWGCCCSYDDETDYWGCCCVPYCGTNGELDGQLDYMMLVPSCYDVDWSNYPDDDLLYNVNSIEDADIRAVAQTYADNGYSIVDPDVMKEYGTVSFGDGEYMFSDGFYAYIQDDNSLTSVDVYKMNETLFDYFVIGSLCGDDYEYTDDGTVITVENGDNEYAEFNRETGVAVCYSHYDYFEAVG